MTKLNFKRFDCNLSCEVYTMLFELARRQGVTMTEIVHRAIRMEKFIEDLMRDEYEVIINGRKILR